jgi:hypothetical protein
MKTADIKYTSYTKRLRKNIKKENEQLGDI